ncbi:hypothetical protein [Phenylobacterium sp.]|uniref:hypothetical protein n=1 Tax=Phenylobacterium sp. TaxID=1871053 RepID=UPI002C92869E|nr:hypothetical protein [Phenylobacterium sp.]HVI34271.1 hypothetical protein [Phenylobacterium sp.]
MLFVSALAALAIAAAPEAAAVEKTAQAPVESTAQTPTLDAKGDAKTKKVCTERPAISGSRMAKKSCRTVPVTEKAAPAPGAKAEAGHDHAH